MSRPLAIACVVLAIGAPASAQSAVPSSGGERYAVSAGLAWLAGYDIGATTASLRRNETGTATPGGFTLFQVDSSFERAVGLDARFSYALSRALSVEAGGTFSRPPLAASITQDAESDPIVLDDQRITQITIEGSVLWRFGSLGSGARTTPYVIGGAGYLRQLDDERSQVETGTTVHAGGGVMYRLTRSGGRRAFGVRGEARLLIRRGAIDFEDKARVAPTVHALAFLGF